MKAEHRRPPTRSRWRTRGSRRATTRHGPGRRRCRGRASTRWRGRSTSTALAPRRPPGATERAGPVGRDRDAAPAVAAEPHGGERAAAGRAQRHEATARRHPRPPERVEGDAGRAPHPWAACDPARREVHDDDAPAAGDRRAQPGRRDGERFRAAAGAADPDRAHARPGGRVQHVDGAAAQRVQPCAVGRGRERAGRSRQARRRRDRAGRQVHGQDLAPRRDPRPAPVGRRRDVARTAGHRDAPGDGVRAHVDQHGSLARRHHQHPRARRGGRHGQGRRRQHQDPERHASQTRRARRGCAGRARKVPDPVLAVGSPRVDPTVLRDGVLDGVAVVVAGAGELGRRCASARRRSARP